MTKLHIDVEIMEIIPSYDLLNKQSLVIIILISSKMETFQQQQQQQHLPRMPLLLSNGQCSKMRFVNLQDLKMALYSS